MKLVTKRIYDIKHQSFRSYLKDWHHFFQGCDYDPLLVNVRGPICDVFKLQWDYRCWDLVNQR